MATRSDLTCAFCTTDSVAIATCHHCKELLCKRCFEIHKSARVYQRHKVVLLGTGEDHLNNTYRDITEEMCITCTRECIAFYCETHDYVGCGACTMRHHKLCKNVTDLSDTNNVKIPTSKLDQLKSDTYKFDDEIGQDKIYIGRNTNTCSDDKAKCLTDVKSFRASIDKELDQLQSKMEKDIHDTYRDIEKQNQEASDLCGSAKKKNHQFKEELETTSERNQPVRVYLYYKRGKHTIEKFRAEISKYKRFKMETYEFTPNNVLKTTMLSKVKSFGSIAIKVEGSDEAPITETQPDAGNGASKQQVNLTYD